MKRDKETMRCCLNLDSLVHASNKSVDVLLSVTSVTTFNEVSELGVSKASVGVGELEGPKELVGFLEMRSNSVNFVDKVLDGDDSELAQVLLNEAVVRKGDSLPVDLGVTSLVDEFTNSLEVGFTVCNVWLNQLEHLLSSLGQSDKHTVVDLEQSEELQNLSWLWCNVGDTTETNDKGNLGLSGNVEVTLGLCQSTEADLFTLSRLVLLGVGLSSLEDDTTLGLLCLWIEKVDRMSASDQMYQGDLPCPFPPLLFLSVSYLLQSDPKDG